MYTNITWGTVHPLKAEYGCGASTWDEVEGFVRPYAAKRCEGDYIPLLQVDSGLCVGAGMYPGIVELHSELYRAAAAVISPFWHEGQALDLQSALLLAEMWARSFVESYRKSRGRNSGGGVAAPEFV